MIIHLIPLSLLLSAWLLPDCNWLFTNVDNYYVIVDNLGNDPQTTVDFVVGGGGGAIWCDILIQVCLKNGQFLYNQNE